MNKQGTINFSVAGSLIVLLYMIVFTGILISDTRATAVGLIPCLFLSILCIVLFLHRCQLIPISLLIAGAFVAGVLVELLGVNSGEVFGKYFSNDAFETSIAMIPVFVSLFFALMIYAVGQAVSYFKLKRRWQKATTGSLMILALVAFLEPVAQKMDYWDWEGDIVPLQNYIVWFIISFVMLHFFYAMQLIQDRKTGMLLYSAQLTFLVLLYFFL